MALSKNSDLTIGDTDSGVLYKNRSAFYDIGAAAGASAAIAIIEAEGFCKFIIFFDFIVPGTNDAFREIFAASYQIKFQLSFAITVRYEMNNTGEFHFNLWLAQAGCIYGYICNCFRCANATCIIFSAVAAISSKSESTAVTAFKQYWFWKWMSGVRASYAIAFTIKIFSFFTI